MSKQIHENVRTLPGSSPLRPECSGHTIIGRRQDPRRMGPSGFHHVDSSGCHYMLGFVDVDTPEVRTPVRVEKVSDTQRNNLAVTLISR